ncbi:MAG: hypothetical protein AAFY10_01100 [Pseudomonadota bacterium]
MAKVERDGERVVIKANSPEEAAEIEAAAHYDALTRPGGWAAGFERVLSGIENMFGVPMGRLPLWVSYVMMAIAMVLAWQSWNRLYPDAGGVTLSLSLLGALLIFGTHWLAGEQAKAFNRGHGDSDQAKLRRLILYGFITVEALMAAGFTAAISVDGETGATVAAATADDLEMEIRRKDREVERLERPRHTAEVLAGELAAELRMPAENMNGDAVGPVAQWVGHGTPEYCVGTGYYIDTYCPDLIDLEQDLLARRAYEAELAKVDALRDQLRAARTAAPRQASTLAAADALGLEGAVRFLPGVILMFVIVSIMAVMAYLAKRDFEDDEPAT